jgi:hypothetical protein
MVSSNPDHADPSTPTSTPAQAGAGSAPRRTGRGHRRRATRTPTTPPEVVVWSIDRIRALGAVTDLRTAAQILGLSANTAYALARRDAFPVPVIRAGGQYRVSVEAILAVLGAPTPPSPPRPPPDAGT